MQACIRVLIYIFQKSVLNGHIAAAVYAVIVMVL